MNVMFVIMILIGAVAVISGIYTAYPIVFAAAGLLFIAAGAIVLLWRSTKRCIWSCPKCGKEFKLSVRLNVLSTNVGVNEKELICPFCNEKSICKGHMS